MNPWSPLSIDPPGRFRVGDRVRIVVGYRGTEAEILEDRGLIGKDKQRYYSIALKREGVEDDILDYPEDEMEPFPLPAEQLPTKPHARKKTAGRTPKRAE